MDGMSSSSTGGSGDLGPTLSFVTYFFISLAFQMVLAVLVGLLAWFLPLNVLLKLAVRLYGFEPVAVVHRHTQKGSLQLAPIKQRRQQADATQPVGSATNRTHLLHADFSPSDSPSAIELDSSSQKTYSPQVSSSPSAKSPPPPDLVVLRHNTNALLAMGRLVDFDATVAEEEERRMDEEEQYNEDGCSSNFPRRVRFLVLCEFIHRGFHCRHRGRWWRGKPMSRSALVQRCLKQMLLLTVYLCVVLFVSIAMMDSAIFRLDSTACPSVVMTEEGWDCFGYETTSRMPHVDCSSGFVVSSDSTNPADFFMLVCYRLVTAEASIYLSALSTIASLFGLVFGGFATVLGWWLGAIHTRPRVRLMFLIPSSITLGFFIASALDRLHTPLALSAPLTLVASIDALINIRLAVGFEKEDGAQQETSLSLAGQSVSYADIQSGAAPSPRPALSSNDTKPREEL